jgi:hypothetical protein
MNYSIYQIDLPERPEAVVFVNGFLARDRLGNQRSNHGELLAFRKRSQTVLPR